MKSLKYKLAWILALFLLLACGTFLLRQVHRQVHRQGGTNLRAGKDIHEVRIGLPLKDLLHCNPIPKSRAFVWIVQGNGPFQDSIPDVRDRTELFFDWGPDATGMRGLGVVVQGNIPAEDLEKWYGQGFVGSSEFPIERLYTIDQNGVGKIWL